MTKQFQSDSDWAIENYSDLMEAYPDQWVAVHLCRVVASGTDLAEVEERATRETGCEEMPVVYVEGDAYVYAS